MSDKPLPQDRFQQLKTEGVGRGIILAFLGGNKSGPVSPKWLEADADRAALSAMMFGKCGRQDRRNYDKLIVPKALWSGQGHILRQGPGRGGGGPLPLMV
jgi:hypothetical protein